MIRGIFKVLSVLAFVLTALGIGALVLFPTLLREKKTSIEQMPRIVIPRTMSAIPENLFNPEEILAHEDSMSAWLPLSDGEAIISVLAGYFDDSVAEKQFIAYRNLAEIESPIYLTFIDYDETTNSYKRTWSAPTAATRQGTARLYTQDLLGDRSVCAILSGMNSYGEHTLTVFRLNPVGSPRAAVEPFSRIAEITIDGSIAIREEERTPIYPGGQNQRQSFTISAYGRDFDSANILDQLEVVYAYNYTSGVYEQIRTTRIPGSQVEQRRVRELLGNRQVFEDFVTGLWFRVTPQGVIDRDQFIYFDSAKKEIVFYGSETQQVFSWQSSTSTRFGLNISTQNNTITSLRRVVDIELETLDTIRIRIIENIRLIRVNSSWDGSYRKASVGENREKPSLQNTHIDATYDGSMGRIFFQGDGTYEINTGDSIRQGKYAFLKINDHEMLELRPSGGSASQREIYLVESEITGVSTRKILTLNQARIGVRGIEKFHERPISLTLIGE